MTEQATRPATATQPKRRVTYKDVSCSHCGSGFGETCRRPMFRPTRRKPTPYPHDARLTVLRAVRGELHWARVTR